MTLPLPLPKGRGVYEEPAGAMMHRQVFFVSQKVLGVEVALVVGEMSAATKIGWVGTVFSRYSNIFAGKRAK